MTKKQSLKRNTFFDINHFPPKEGMLVFGISISKIGTTQNAKNCFNQIEHFIKKIILPKVGLTFLYSDNLYLYTSKSASDLKNKHQSLCISHKFQFQKILEKEKRYIRDSFSYITWSQALLESKDFTNYFGRLIKIYEKDKLFNKYVKEDIKNSKKRVSQNTIMFILEEILVFYLIAKGKIRIPNVYLKEHEKWVLNCYPGKPLKSEIYLFQKNFFKLNNKNNIYENAFYDLKDKKLYKYNYIDLK